MTKLLSRAAPVKPDPMRSAAAAPRPVGFYDCRGAGLPGHDRQTKIGLARLLAELLGVDYAGEVLWGTHETVSGAEGEAWRLQFAVIFRFN